MNASAEETSTKMFVEQSPIQVMSTVDRRVAKIELDNGISFSINESSLPLKIGRDTNCDICIPLSQVSRRHCELSLINDTLCIRDVSTNGTWVGEIRLKGESFVIQSRTSVHFTDAVKIVVTPCGIGEESDDQRVISERRVNERRNMKRRQIVSVVESERRQHETRRKTDRRSSSRRFISTLRIEPPEHNDVESA